MASYERARESGERFVAEYRKNAETLALCGLYDPSQEHDSCGVGLVAAIDGKPRREVVSAGIAALKVLWHRGAVDADGKTGDGAGIHVQIPQNFLKEHIRDQGHEPGEGRLAVGMIFLPRTDFSAQERCRCIVEAEILAMGYGIYGWRQVPIDISVIGEKANATRPEIEQILINNTKGTSARQFEIDLFIVVDYLQATAADWLRAPIRFHEFVAKEFPRPFPELSRIDEVSLTLGMDLDGGGVEECCQAAACSRMV